ncbi:hypothetical protein LTR50_002660 [Elasticomyces elasticus]|nr:hypothetical protein LTR50_002660 [Elasticomyces elasticus]
MDGPPPPPPPPPHGQHSKYSGLPPGNYDVFIVPPHSAGGGFLYLPSLQPHRNSFLAGVACTLFAVGVWVAILPVLKHWLATASGGIGAVLLVLGVGVAGWAWGRTQLEGGALGPEPGGDGTSSKGAHSGQHSTGPQANGYTRDRPGPNTAGPGHGAGRAYAGSPPQQHHQYQNTPPSGSEPPPAPKSAAASGWEKAREETRKREEERKRTEELRKRREELQKQREEAEKGERAKAEKEKWEQARAREREAREREARERIAKERIAKDKEKDQRDRPEAEVREKLAREKAERETKPTVPPSPGKRYEKPSAKSFIGTENEEIHSFRPYDTPKRPTKMSSQSSVSGISESSYAPSQSTARTTPPPSHRGPYSTKDPDKIVIKAVYLFNDLFPKPVAQLASGVGSVTDGLILRVTTEGLFIDDVVRGVPQREWDVKAWTMKSVEVGCPLFVANASAPTTTAKLQSRKDPVLRFLGGTGIAAKDNNNSNNLTAEELDLVLERLLRSCKAECGDADADANASQTGELTGLHVLRATIRDTEGKKYVFVIPQEEGWKVAVGLQRLRRGSQVRSLGVNALKEAEIKTVLSGLGW